MDSTLDDAGDESTLYELLENNDDTFCIGPLFRSSSCILSVFSVLFAASLRNYTFVDESDTEDGKSSCSFPILSPIWVSYSISLRMNFVTELTNLKDVRAQFVNVSMNVEELAHIATLRSSISPYIPRWTIPVKIVSTKKKTCVLKSSLAYSKQIWNPLECAFSVALMSDLSISNTCMRLDSYCTICLIISRRNGWLTSSARVVGTSDAGVDLNGEYSSSNSKVGSSATAGSCNTYWGFWNVV